MKEKLKEEVKNVLVSDLLITSEEFDKRWIVLEKLTKNTEILNNLIKKAKREEFRNYTNSAVHYLSEIIFNKIRS